MSDITRLYVARHGETEYNRNHRIQGRGINAPLNARGERQGRLLAEYFDDVRVDRIFSSSLIRARQTADFVASRKNRDVASFSDLDEMHFGVYEGRIIDEIEDDVTEMHQAWKAGSVHIGPDEGESPRQVYDRANRRVQNLLEQHAGQTVLLVIHGRLIRILLSNWLGLGLSRMHEVDHANAAVNLLNFNSADQRFEPEILNYTDHLSPLLEVARS